MFYRVLNTALVLVVTKTVCNKGSVQFHDSSRETKTLLFPIHINQYWFLSQTRIFISNLHWLRSAQHWLYSFQQFKNCTLMWNCSSNWNKGSSIYYVRKMLQKTNVAYPWYAHVRLHSRGSEILVFQKGLCMCLMG